MLGACHGIQGSALDGGFSIGGHDLRTQAIWVVDLWRLWERPPFRKENVLLDAAEGTRSYEGIYHERTLALETLLSGEVAWDDPTQPISPFTEANVWQQYRVNFEHYCQVLVDPPGTARGTKPAIVVWPDQVTQDEGPVQVDALLQGRRRTAHFVVCTLQITIPAGYLVVGDESS